MDNTNKTNGEFTDKQIQQIKDIIAGQVHINYFSGNPRTDPHSHNGTDNLQINPMDLIGFTPVPTSTQKYLNKTTGLMEYGFGSAQQLAGGSPTFLGQSILNPEIAVYPIPMITGAGTGSASAFEGGYAPEGTLVYFFNSPTTSGLYIRILDTWQKI